MNKKASNKQKTKKDKQVKSAPNGKSVKAGQQRQNTARQKKAGQEENRQKVKEELNYLKEELDTLNDKYMRLLAEFENFKKRAEREKVAFAQLANKDLMLTLLPVIDDMERALDAIRNAKEVDAVQEGVHLVFKKLKESLENKGLQPMESIRQPFDPERHEAISNLKVNNKSLKGKVVDEVEKGYYLNDKIIRHAKVVVGE